MSGPVFSMVLWDILSPSEARGCEVSQGEEAWGRSSEGTELGWWHEVAKASVSRRASPVCVCDSPASPRGGEQVDNEGQRSG